MGKRNRERRRSKQRAAAQRGAPPRPGANRTGPAGDHAGGAGGWPSSGYDRLPADRVFMLLVEAGRAGLDERGGHLLGRLLTQWAAPVAIYRGPSVPEAVAGALASGVQTAWGRGWQPADLVHALGRKQTAPLRRMLVDAIAAEAASWRHHPDAHPVWLAHLDELDARRWWGEGTSHLDAWAGRERSDKAEVLLVAAQLVALLWSVPGLPPVSDPPSEWGRPRPTQPSARRRPAPAGIDERILHRVRALLAKAESTDFPAEAESLTAKAQELMGRYSIDRAMVSAGGTGGGAGEVPAARRVLIHDPYAKGKSLLLAGVAGACRSRAVYAPDVGFSTVFGFPVDLDVVEILYTSLVTQCSAAMQVASRNVANPRSFRDSFTVAFASRISDRLEEATAATVAEGRRDHGDALLPVLASRQADVESARDAAFPELTRRSFRAADGRGWAAGRAAAEAASLSVGKAVTG